jgi:hypothetical protein
MTRLRGTRPLVVSAVRLLTCDVASGPGTLVHVPFDFTFDADQ